METSAPTWPQQPLLVSHLTSALPVHPHNNPNQLLKHTLTWPLVKPNLPRILYLRWNFPATFLARGGHLLTSPLWPLCQSHWTLGSFLAVLGVSKFEATLCTLFPQPVAAAPLCLAKSDSSFKLG